jgi:hypothetical protein
MKRRRPARALGRRSGFVSCGRDQPEGRARGQRHAGSQSRTSSVTGQATSTYSDRGCFSALPTTQWSWLTGRRRRSLLATRASPFRRSLIRCQGRRQHVTVFRLDVPKCVPYLHTLDRVQRAEGNESPAFAGLWYAGEDDLCSVGEFAAPSASNSASPAESPNLRASRRRARSVCRL